MSYPIAEYKEYTQQDIKRNLKKLMVPVSAPNPGETAVYRNALCKEGLMSAVPGVPTVYEAFNMGLKLAGPDSPCFGHRAVITASDTATGNPVWSPWTWQSRIQVSERRFDFGSGLVRIKSKLCGTPITESQWTFGIYATNRPTWVIADHAGYAYSLIPVALFDTLGPDAAEYIINHAELAGIVCSADKISNILRVAHKCPTLKFIVSMDALEGKDASTSSQHHAISGIGANAAIVLKQWAAEKRIELYSFEQVESMGKANRVPVNPPKPSDIATICYTSGTTGAVTTHANFAAVNSGMSAIGMRFNSSDLHISYLPLAHAYERITMLGMVSNGVPVAFYRGDISLLFEDIADIKPTIFCSVPRLYNRIYAAILAKTVHSGSAIAAALFERGLAAKTQALKDGHLTHSFWDLILFNKIKNVLGGRVRMMVSGSAPISAEVLNLLRVCFSCEVLEGFGIFYLRIGQTETAAVASVNLIGDYRAGGSIGPIIPCTEVKLVDIPDMRYTSQDKPHPRGEIWIRGENIMREYHKEPTKTDEALNAEGWLATGDVGTIDDRGLIRIIDRKKHIFKLSQGEYVAPEKLENIFVQSGYVAQLFIYGDSMENELVAVIVPEPEFSVKQAVARGLLPKNTINPGPIQPGQPLPKVLATLAKDAQFKSVVFDDLLALGKEAKLAGFEFPKAIYLEGVDLMSVDNGLLTPTLKLRRDVAKDFFKVQIKAMYDEIKAGKPAVSAKL